MSLSLKNKLFFYKNNNMKYIIIIKNVYKNKYKLIITL